MTEINLLYDLGAQKITDQDLLNHVKNNFELIPAIIEGVSSSNPRIKYGCAKTLSKLSQEHPGELYKEIDTFIQLLESKNNIIKWNAMDILANLTTVDKKKKFDEIFTRYFGLIDADTMITVGHVVDNSGKIANAKPHLTEKITNELLRLEKLKTKPRVTQECKNILYGKAILAFDQYYDQISDKKEVISFVRRQLKNTRAGTKVKAEKFLKKNQ